MSRRHQRVLPVTGAVLFESLQHLFCHKLMPIDMVVGMAPKWKKGEWIGVGYECCMDINDRNSRFTDNP